MKIEIVPSLASASQLHLKDELLYALNQGVSELHFDIEDGHFIPNITFGIKLLKELRTVTDIPIHVHLMVMNPEYYAKELAAISSLTVTLHVEATAYPLQALHDFQTRGISAGVAFQPSTSLQSYLYVIEKADNVLVMMCEPDGQGQQYLLSMEEKLQALLNQFPHKEIWVDGAVTLEIARRLASYRGMKLKIVMGRTFFLKEWSLKQMLQKLNS